MYSIGIDSGSRMTKVCLFDIDSSQIIDTKVEDTHIDYELQFDSVIELLLNSNNITSNDVKDIICTGYGRKNYSKATKSSSEIICHAKGVNFFNSNIRTIIDIGGQDSKIIKISSKGKVLDFLMNDKCAAGTGRFLEKVANLFKIDLQELEKYSEKSDKDIDISSTCVVFAESEIISLISSGEKKENIIRAIHNSIIHRIMAMSGRVNIEFPVAFVGGVAKNYGMIKALKEYLGSAVYIPPIPEITGALGASLSYIK